MKIRSLVWRIFEKRGPANPIMVVELRVWGVPILEINNKSIIELLKERVRVNGGRHSNLINLIKFVLTCNWKKYTIVIGKKTNVHV